MFLRSVATVGGYTLASRVLGFIRDILIAAFLGAGPIADAFLFALRLPNLFRRLFAEGAFNAAFVPVFSGVLTDRGPRMALAFAENVLSLMFVAMTLITIAAELAMPELVFGLAPGLADKEGGIDAAVEMAAITFPYLWLITLASLMGAVLNALGRFAAAAAAPCLLNLFMIGGLVFARDALETPGHVLSVAVAFAGIAQLAMMAWAVERAGYSLRLVLPRFTPDAVRMLKLMGPGALSAGAMQINLLIGTLIASLLPTGAITYLYFADRIYQLPLGVVGVATGTALLPRLSASIKAGRLDDARIALNRAIELSLFLTLPAAAALLAIPILIVSILLERGEFDSQDAVATGRVLAVYAAGLPAFVLVKVLSPGFFAHEDTLTPLRIALVAVGANVVLSLILYKPFGAMGLAAATSLASWINTGLLALILFRRGALVPDRELLSRVPKALAACVLMGAAVYAGADFAGSLVAKGSLAEIAVFSGLCFSGAVAYFAVAWWIGAADKGAIAALLQRPLDRIRRRRDKP